MVRWCVLVVAIAACDSGQPPAPAPPPAPGEPCFLAADARVASTARAVPPSPEPPPVEPTPQTPLEKLYDMPTATALADGSGVLLAIRDRDGARGAPNLAFEVRDRNDRVIKRVVVEKLDETVDAKTMAARIAKARALIDGSTTVPMGFLAPAVEQDDPDHQIFGSDAITIDWKVGSYALLAGKTRIVSRSVPAAWRGGHDRNDVCTHPEFLAGAQADAKLKLMVVDVDYRGNDSCWEDTNRLHVVAW